MQNKFDLMRFTELRNFRFAVTLEYPSLISISNPTKFAKVSGNLLQIFQKIIPIKIYNTVFQIIFDSFFQENFSSKYDIRFYGNVMLTAMHVFISLQFEAVFSLWTLRSKTSQKFLACIILILVVEDSWQGQFCFSQMCHVVSQLAHLDVV